MPASARPMRVAYQPARTPVNEIPPSLLAVRGDAAEPRQEEVVSHLQQATADQRPADDRAIEHQAGEEWRQRCRQAARHVGDARGGPRPPGGTSALTPPPP